MSDFLIELPRYKSHKVVSALQISAILPNPRGIELHWEEQQYAAVEVTYAWFNKHAPSIGWYVVWYDDGYVSASPADAFEGGYKRIGTIDSNAIPDWAACKEAVFYGTAGPLEEFIYNHAPNAKSERESFNAGLKALIEHLQDSKPASQSDGQSVESQAAQGDDGLDDPLGR